MYKYYYLFGLFFFTLTFGYIFYRAHSNRENRYGNDWIGSIQYWMLLAGCICWMFYTVANEFIEMLIGLEFMRDLFIAYITIIGVVISIIWGFLYSTFLNARYTVKSSDNVICLHDEKMQLLKRIEARWIRTRQQGRIIIIWFFLSFVEFIYYYII